MAKSNRKYIIPLLFVIKKQLQFFFIIFFVFAFVFHEEKCFYKRNVDEIIGHQIKHMTLVEECHNWAMGEWYDYELYKIRPHEVMPLGDNTIYKDDTSLTRFNWQLKERDSLFNIPLQIRELIFLSSTSPKDICEKNLGWYSYLYKADYSYAIFFFIDLDNEMLKILDVHL